MLYTIDHPKNIIPRFLESPPNIPELDRCIEWAKGKEFEGLIEKKLRKKIFSAITNGNDENMTPPIRRVDLSDEFGITQGALSKKGSKWDELFKEYSVGENQSVIPLNLLLPMIIDYCKRTGKTGYPHTEADLRKALMR